MCLKTTSGSFKSSRRASTPCYPFLRSLFWRRKKSPIWSKAKWLSSERAQNRIKSSRESCLIAQKSWPIWNWPQSSSQSRCLRQSVILACLCSAATSSVWWRVPSRSSGSRSHSSARNWRQSGNRSKNLLLRLVWSSLTSQSPSALASIRITLQSSKTTWQAT